MNRSQILATFLKIALYKFAALFKNIWENCLTDLHTMVAIFLSLGYNSWFCY